MVAVLPEYIKAGMTVEDIWQQEELAPSARLAAVMDETPEHESLVYTQDCSFLPARAVDEEYDGPRLIAYAKGGKGMGWSVYSSEGPAVTLKTWGQGPGGPTALYLHNGQIRRLSPREALAAHSFSSKTMGVVESMLREREISWSQIYRLAGNSIPVGMLNSVVRGVVSIVDAQVYSDRKKGRSPSPT